MCNAGKTAAVSKSLRVGAEYHPLQVLKHQTKSAFSWFHYLSVHSALLPFQYCSQLPLHPKKNLWERSVRSVQNSRIQYLRVNFVCLWALEIPALPSQLKKDTQKYGKVSTKNLKKR